MDRRVLRKTKRGQALVQQNLPDISFKGSPSSVIALLNFGYTTGASSEKVYELFNPFGTIKSISILPNMSFCFIEMQDVKSSAAALNTLHGSEFEANGAANQLYLSFVEKSDGLQSILKNERLPAPVGLKIVDMFVNETEEDDVVKKIEEIAESGRGSEGGSLKHRTVLHFGYDFDYSSNNVDRSKDPVELPSFLKNLVERMQAQTLLSCVPDQVTVNIYEPGQGIPPHVDTHSAFEEDLVSLSLGSAVVMEYKHPSGKKSEVVLKPRSLVIMTGEARYVWKHGIVPRRNDLILNDSGELICIKRSRRISVTFRKVRWQPCSCPFIEHCDRSKSGEVDESVADQLEKLHVFNVYDEIASHFSATRHSPWPGVTRFLSSIEEGSVLLDVGCGNAKYFGLCKNLFEVGCDRSVSLLGIANGRGFQCFAADCRDIPFRNGVVDYVISIAVIHHLATTARRLLALTEMARLLRPGGRCLVSVWSKDQGNSKYLQETRNGNEADLRGEFNLPVHKNRTQFVHGDVLVPWTLKKKGPEADTSSVYHRYYHVFEEEEFRQLCESIPDVEVSEIFQEQGNWIVVFQKRK